MLISRSAALGLALLSAASVPAQTLQLLSSPSLVVPAEPRQAADYIVALVNSEPITHNELRQEQQRVAQQRAQQRQPAIPSAELSRLVLERLINDRAQLQLARETGIRVDEPALDQAEESIARQNQMDVAQLTRRLAADGIQRSQFRAQLRDQIALSRLREREVDARVKVSDPEVEQYLREQQANRDPAQLEINLAQILVAVPDEADARQIAQLQEKAQGLAGRARAGEDFAALAREFSNAPERANGGQMGLRPAQRYPSLFLEATQNLDVGQVAGPLRSGAGFHILKVLEMGNAGLPPATVMQSRARHILLRTGAALSETAAIARLDALKQRLVSGQADFADLARENSQDGSAAQGGDLGWAAPGMFVPEFEQVMNQLAPGQVSEPLVSRFGVHLIQLLERRTVPVSAQEQRERVRAMLRERKLDEAFASWAQDVRSRAYVELREPPL
jgi:peptidyl-prolyl cis-trans isomerase SurA